MQIKDVDKLKAWLLKKLEPLCDADPVALAKYVVALLRKEKPKSALRELCVDQLEVFLAKETAGFVEKLFRCLDGDSYMKGEDTTPPRTPPTFATPACTLNRATSIVSPPPAKQETTERQQSEELRHKEVDDDDRDFRRSRRRDAEGGSSGGGDRARKITAPIGVGSVGGALRPGLGKKRIVNPVPDSGTSKRRIVINHGPDMEAAALHHRSAGSVVTTSSLGPGGARRPVRDRLGPRGDDGRTGDRGRKIRDGKSGHSSSSSSSSSSGSDSDSSTSRNKRGGGGKRRKVGGAEGGMAMGGGAVEVKRKQRCKDYDKRGFCILGEKCQFDHGLDPVVIDGTMNPYGHPPPGLSSSIGGVPTLPPPPDLLGPPIIPQGMSGRHSPTSTKAESYNPEEPGLGSTAPSHLIPTHIAPPPPLPLRPMFPPPHMPGLMPPHFPPPPHHHHPHHPHHHPFPPANMIPLHPMRPRLPHFPGGGRLPYAKPSDSLILRKIPRDSNSITKLSGHFEKFGTIVNLTVRYEGDLEGAMVQFSSPAEAKRAHDCTEAILNNRFIRVYYLRRDDYSFPPPLFHECSLEGPVSVAVSSIHSMDPFPFPSSTTVATVTSSEPHAPVHPTPDSSVGGAEAEPPSHATVASSDSRKTVDTTKPHPPSQTAPSTTTSSSSFPASKPSLPLHRRPLTQQQQSNRAEAAKKNLELQKKAQELLHKQIEQQKLLITKLEKSGKNLSVEEKNKIMKNLKALSSNITKLAEVANKAVLTQKQEQLQPPVLPETREADMKQAWQKAALKEKAEALRKEAHKLGLLSSPSQPLPPSSTRKGQGKPDLRGKLHGKPRQLLVLGAKNRDQLTTYFESFGGLDSVGVDPANGNNLIFTFRNSISATQVVHSSSTFQGKPLIMKWYSPKPRPSATPTVSSTNSNVPHRAATPTALESEPAVPTTPTLTKLDPQDLHLVEDSDDDEDDSREGRPWRR